MKISDFASALGPALVSALTQKGFESLTPVQQAVLTPETAHRDLRITSQTGSGKTVAIGLSLREIVLRPRTTGLHGAGRPHALVVAPTRELAKQVEEELTWLFASSGVQVLSVTGGASYRDERRALGQSPAVVVGTPGRLLDHLTRGSIDGGSVAAVVLDEADRLLDLGFRDDLEAILAKTPPDHLTHLCSATFPREVRALADSVQRNPAHVEGTPLGAANADIDHVVHLVSPHQRTDAIVNLLLAQPDAQTLIFARTRADVGRIAEELREAGFGVTSLSGEMDQSERNRALAAFKRGDLQALVATDVAARGIDVQDITRVIHAEPPTDPDSYTHRSGRTGRAGRKGTSAMLVAPMALSRTSSLLARAKVQFRIEPIPTAAEIRGAVDDRLIAELSRVAEDETFDPSTWGIAGRLAGSDDVVRVIARLLVRARHTGRATPREVKVIHAPSPRAPGAYAPRDPRDARTPYAARGRAPEGAARPVYATPRGSGAVSAEGDRAYEARARAARVVYPAADGPRAPRNEPYVKSGDWVAFRVSWGSEHGADARRLLAMLCRRGGIQGSDVGTIRVARAYSLVEVKGAAAPAFAQASAVVDPRNPRVTIRAAAAGETAAPAEAGNFDVPRPRPSGPLRPTMAGAPPRRAPRPFK